MKRLISTMVAVAVILALTAIPAMAATVDTGVNVGNNSTAPYMIASTMTPDETAGDGVQVNPEFAIPNANGTFPPTNTAADGWKKVCFYVEIGHVNGIDTINNVAIDVNYPATFAIPADAALFGPRAGTLKFEINVARNPTGGWSAPQIVYPYPEAYPDGTPAPLPALTVRELVYGTPSDWVDVNADGLNTSPPDLNWQNFLNLWGTPRVSYAAGETALSAFDKYQLGQALVLEICGWFWFHQPGVKYVVQAKAATESGATSPVLGDAGKFLNYNRVFGLYIDFSQVNYGSVEVGQTSWAMGDRFLITPALPTVWNNGNVSAQVLVQSTKMVKDYAGVPADIHDSIYYNSPAKTIEHFDAKLYYTNGAGAVVQLGDIDYLADAVPAVIAVGTPAESDEVGPSGPVLLQACRPAKIEFSVHPELNEAQEAGNYRGFLTLAVQAYTGTQLPTP